VERRLHQAPLAQPALPGREKQAVADERFQAAENPRSLIILVIGDEDMPDYIRVGSKIGARAELHDAAARQQQ